MRKSKISCVGEVLVDFVSTSTGTLSSSNGFEKALGGESANVAVGLAKLGTTAAFAGKVGADSFGRFLVAELKRLGVDVRGMLFDAKHKTRLAFVSLMDDGGRDFEFWEKSPAGEQLKLSDINLRMLKDSRLVNIAPLLLVREPSRSAALALAKKLSLSGTAVAFDANLRLGLWTSSAEAKRVLLQMVPRCSVLRLNDEEAAFLTGTRKVETAARKLLSLGPRLVAVTLGEKGCYFRNAAAEGFCSGYAVKPIDTTGCGDAFFAALLHGIAKAECEPGNLSGEELHRICSYANAVGALTSLHRGGAAAIPYPSDVEAFLSAQQQTGDQVNSRGMHA